MIETLLLAIAADNRPAGDAALKKYALSSRPTLAGKASELSVRTGCPAAPCSKPPTACISSTIQSSPLRLKQEPGGTGRKGPSPVDTNSRPSCTTRLHNRLCQVVWHTTKTLPRNVVTASSGGNS
eukprot:2109433-Amphidinium_carterae.1